MDLTNLNKDKDRAQRRKSTLDLGTMVYGKVPPQAKDLEESILGAIMLERDAYDLAAAILRPEMFYVDAHQRVMSAMQRLANKSQPIDIHTLVEELRSMEEIEMVGGPYYITKLTNAVVSSANIESHCRIVLQKFIGREIIRVCGEMIGQAYEDSTDVFDLLDEAQESLSIVSEASNLGDMVPIDAVLVKAIQQIEANRHLGKEFTGIPSGFRDLDRATLGWQDGELIILAARPAVGKTAFGLNIIRNAATHLIAQPVPAKYKKSVAVWSLEMKSIKLVLRMLAAESQELLYRIQTGHLSEDQMKNIYKRGIQILSQLSIFFDDTSGLTLQKLRSKARKLKRKNNLGLIVVDYLQLMTPDERKGTREQEVSRISRGLKNLAQELNIPIIALSQMSREFEKRGGGVPYLSDLRESGSLEQDADVVMFMYGPSEGEIAADMSLADRKYLKVAKQRNGVLVTQDLNFKDEIQLFEAIEKIPELPGMGSNWKPVSITRELPPEKDEDPF